MRPKWNIPRKKEDLQIPERYLQKDAQTQDRRQLTFLLQEAAFSEHIPVYCVIDVEELADAEKEQFLCTEFDCLAAIMLGLPVKELLLFMEQQVPGISGSRTESMAELKVKNYLLDFSDKLEFQGYQTKMVLPSVTPDFSLARMLAASRKGFVGKNGRFVTEDHGSSMCIGILLTDAPLMGGDYRYPDYRGDGCGDCRRCIEECPAGALSDAGFDCGKCFAYRDDPKNQLQIARHSVMKCMKCMEMCPFGQK